MTDIDFRRYFKDLWTVGAGMALAMAIDFLFYFLSGRLLGPEEFGVFGSVMAIYYVAVRSPFKSLEMTSKKIEAEGRDALSSLGRPTLKLGVAAWAAFSLLSTFISGFFSIPLETLLVFSLVFPGAYILPVMLGRLHGRQRFREYALYESLGSAVGFTAVGLVLYGLGSTGAVTAPVLEVFTGLVLMYFLLQPRPGKEAFSDWKLLTRSVVLVVSVSAAFSVDIVLLKLFKDSFTVGLYNAVGIFGKGIFFSAVALNRSVFPKFVVEEDARKKLLHLSLGLIVLGAGAAYIFFGWAGPELIRFTFGAEYAPAASFAPLYMVFISVVSAVALVGNYYLSFDKKRLWLVLSMPAVQVPGIVLFHETVRQVVTVGIVSALLALILLYLPVLQLQDM